MVEAGIFGALVISDTPYKLYGASEITEAYFRPKIPASTICLVIILFSVDSQVYHTINIFCLMHYRMMGIGPDSPPINLLYI